jgi:hypothetical protein
VLIGKIRTARSHNVGISNPINKRQAIYHYYETMKLVRIINVKFPRHEPSIGSTNQSSVDESRRPMRLPAWLSGVPLWRDLHSGVRNSTSLIIVQIVELGFVNRTRSTLCVCHVYTTKKERGPAEMHWVLMKLEI